MKKINKRSAVIAGAAAVAVGLGGVAFAAWTADSTGSGTTSAAGTLTGVTVNNVTITGTLRPGTDADVDVAVTNPAGNGQVRILSVVRDGTITADAAHAAAGCAGAATGVTFTDTTLATPQTVNDGAAATVAIANAVLMSNDSHNSCQGATFTIPLKVSAETTGS
ncbi:hypothetical protein GCM10010124_00590 [Pilimelia terevasa]|uniref:SipW-cognate class signal peptide n=1 Tax=Pilimelia terevasa TaxID=53372 RepID=A0A8J3BHN3_9ACTN|nr:hypothetical protein [Pilimelia terevasa]GGK11818.1 hypothetical protein GCM10010124_00590 [Pilimelia terevasa]